MDEAPKKLTLGTRVLQVRARDKDTLSAIRRIYFKGHGSRIEATPGRDYQFRFYVTQQEYADAVVVMAADVDYGNFKAACGARKWGLGLRYISLLHDVWNAWFQAAQKGTPLGRTWAEDWQEYNGADSDGGDHGRI